MIIAEITEINPRTNPTERSIPPVMMTKVSPAAKRRAGEEVMRMLFKVLGDKKPVPVKLKRTHRKRRKKTTQFLPKKEEIVVQDLVQKVTFFTLFERRRFTLPPLASVLRHSINILLSFWIIYIISGEEEETRNNSLGDFLTFHQILISPFCG